MHLSCLGSQNCTTWKCVLSQPDLRVFQRAYCHVKGALLSLSWSAPCVWGHVTIEESPRWQITGHTCSYPTPEHPRNTPRFELFCSVSHFPSCLSSYIYPFVNSRNLKTGLINTHCLFPLLRRGFHTAANSWKVYHPSVNLFCNFSCKMTNQFSSFKNYLNFLPRPKWLRGKVMWSTHGKM